MPRKVRHTSKSTLFSFYNLQFRLVAYAARLELYKNVGDSFSLTDLPPTNKIALMEHFDEWMTDRSITRKKVDDFMVDLSNIGKKLDGKYLIYTTSGSTGNPCVVLYDDTTINVSSAIGVLRSFARKQDMKAYMKQGKKTLALFAEGGFYLASGSVKYNLRKMPWKKNMMKSCDVRKKTQDIIDMMNDFQPTMIGSYPTALELLAYEQESGNLHVKPKADAMNELKRILNPELLNRIDDVVVFNALSEKEVSAILDLQIDEFRKRIAEKGLDITLKPSARRYFVENGYDPAFGARPMRRLIQRELEDATATLILQGKCKKGSILTAEAKNDKLVLEVKAESDKKRATAAAEKASGATLTSGTEKKRVTTKKASSSTKKARSTTKA